MKSILALLALVALVGYVHSQLILDEDNPHDRKILDKIVAKINEAEHKHYKLKNVIYTLGDGPKFTLYLNVLDTDGSTVSCTVAIIRITNDDYSTGTVHCNIH